MKPTTLLSKVVSATTDATVNSPGIFDSTSMYLAISAGAVALVFILLVIAYFYLRSNQGTTKVSPDQDVASKTWWLQNKIAPIDSNLGARNIGDKLVGVGLSMSGTKVSPTDFERVETATARSWVTGSKISIINKKFSNRVSTLPEVVTISQVANQSVQWQGTNPAVERSMSDNEESISIDISVNDDLSLSSNALSSSPDTERGRGINDVFYTDFLDHIAHLNEDVSVGIVSDDADDSDSEQSRTDG